MNGVGDIIAYTRQQHDGDDAMTNVQNPQFKDFIADFEALIAEGLPEASLLDRGTSLLQRLIATSEWLPSQFAEPGNTYRQYLLHVDPQERFSVVSFVWGPGQKTPVHNHTVWGLVGMLQGEEIAQAYSFGQDGALVPDGEPKHLLPGQVDRVSAADGDLHSVENALPDRPSISIHVYGSDIGKVKRSSFQLDGTEKLFVSGYTNA